MKMIMLTVLAAVSTAFILWNAAVGSFERYAGHGAYDWFWRDLNSALLAKSDYNGDGRVDSTELERSRLEWVKANGLLVWDCKLYRNGEAISAEEAAALAFND